VEDYRAASVGPGNEALVSHLVFSTVYTFALLTVEFNSVFF